MKFPKEIEIVTASERVTILPILSLCNENNNVTKMFLKKLKKKQKKKTKNKKKKKTARYSNNDALKIAEYCQISLRWKSIGWRFSVHFVL